MAIKRDEIIHETNFFLKRLSNQGSETFTHFSMKKEESVIEEEEESKKKKMKWNPIMIDAFFFFHLSLTHY